MSGAKAAAAAGVSSSGNAAAAVSGHAKLSGLSPGAPVASSGSIHSSRQRTQGTPNAAGTRSRYACFVCEMQ
jgi:hypothetical protein